MIKEAIGTGATIEEAKEQAVAILGASFEDNVEIEVLSMPKRKTLGLFGGSPAKVRVSMEVPDPKPEPKPLPKKPAPAADRTKAADRPAQNGQRRPAERRNDAGVRNGKAAAPAQKRQPPVSERPPRPRNEAAEAKPAPQSPSNRTVTGPAVPAAQVDPNTPAGRATAYLQKIFSIMQLDGVELTVSPVEGGSQIDLTGDGLGVIIGRRGETLDALQYLASLAATSGDGGFYRLVLNTGNYRQKREQTLQSLARRMAAQVLRTGRNRTLEPMNPYERRVIHTTIQSMEGVISNSVGDGAARRVVISPDRAGASFEKPRDNAYSDGPRPRTSRPGFRDYREKSPAAQRPEGQKEQSQRSRSEIEAFEAKAAGKSVILPENPAPAPAQRPAEPVPAPVPTKKDVGDAPLYGRIDKKSE